jgi:dipeptidyl aminopeptidase/acylaminoacyl peptidase
VSDDQTPTPATSFEQLADYVALPRTGGLVLSPDGRRLVVGVSEPDAKGTRYVQSLWELDPTGSAPARRLTRGGTGESAAAFTADGDLLFTAKRPDPQDASPDTDAAPLWLLPAAGGEARLLASRTGGFGMLRAARAAATVVLTTPVLPGADLATDDERRKARKDAGVSGILHSSYPVRYWDHDLGPATPHLSVARLSDDRAELRDLTPDAREVMLDTDFDVSPDGSTVVAAWSRPVGGVDRRDGLYRIDVASGERTLLLADPDADLSHPRISPDGTTVAFARETVTAPQTAPTIDVGIVPLAGGVPPRLLGGDWDRWPSDLAWLPDSSALLVTADDDGRAPIWRMPLDGAPATRLTTDDLAYSELQPAPDGTAVFAMRTSYAAPPHPVRVALADGAVTVLPAPAPLPELPGRLDEVRCTSADGVPLRGWLALPHSASAQHPAPLLLWIHGGPLGSWNAWSWRWNPWLMVAQGYAVLLPDPALSTGYGQDFVQRGWGAWGGPPFTDLMDVTDATLTRPDVDADRIAAMGGSFGGYMANWVAGHTDRFAAIVTHASLWSLAEFGGTTDVGSYWMREMTPEMALANSPHLSVARINTPMLVVHGDKDYRVPIGQGQRLWFDLLQSSALAADEHGRSPHRFLYFPTENHWVLTPQHAALWYRVVLDFLAEHVLGADPAPVPELLGGPPADEKSGEAKTSEQEK